MKYLPVDALVALVDEPNRSACARILADHRALFETVPGSTHNHQAWPGGYLDHVQEIMNIAVVLYDRMSELRPLPFSKSDLLLVVFLHDLEKPWKYELGEDGHLRHKEGLASKEAHQKFRMQKLAEYGVALTPEHENGLKYVEGELSDYTNRERKMHPLAALAHMCDVASARLWFDHPAEQDDPWAGAHRTTSWFLALEKGEDARPSVWRQRLLDTSSATPEIANTMPLSILVFTVQEFWTHRRALKSGEDYKQYLRRYGGNDGSDWHETKVEVDRARESIESLDAHLERFARGDLGDWKKTYEAWLAVMRERVSKA